MKEKENVIYDERKHRHFMRITQSRKGYVMRHGRRFINMFLHWPTERAI